MSVDMNKIMTTLRDDPEAVAAILEGPEAFAKVGTREGVGISLIRFRCNCGGLCDSRGPCPMGGDRWEWTPIGRDVAMEIEGCHEHRDP